MWGMQSWCRYDIPLAAPSAILYLEGQSKSLVSTDLPASSSTSILNTFEIEHTSDKTLAYKEITELAMNIEQGIQLENIIFSVLTNI